MTKELPNLQRGTGSVIQFLRSLSADDFRDWFLEGFRAFVANEAKSQPFNEVRSAYPEAEDISDALAFAYFDLRNFELRIGSQDPFTIGLEAAFRSLSAAYEEDRCILVHILRLAAKISFGRLLPHIVKMLFPRDEQPEKSLNKLRDVAVDAAVELSSRSPHATKSLGDIINSNLFRPSAVGKLLFALCDAEPNDLLAHLMRLEKPLVEVYGDVIGSGDYALWRKRSFLLADIARFSLQSEVFTVIDYCLCNRHWPLAWLGDVLLDPQRFENLPPPESERLINLREELRGYSRYSAHIPNGGKSLSIAVPTIRENRTNTDILLSDDAMKDDQENVRLSVVRRLSGRQSRQGLIPAKLQEQILNDSEAAEAA